MKTLLQIFLLAFDNDLDAFVPELWAQESLAILEENMVVANMIHRDFENVVANYGDIVNANKPGEFTAQRKNNSEDVVVQDATAVNIPVKLNQHWHTSFLIKDGEDSLSFTDLVQKYLRPAIVSIAQAVDKVLLGQTYQFLGNAGGTLGNTTLDTTIKKDILAVREVQNVKKVPMGERNLILTPSTETAALSVEEFTEADKVGDDGTALREASLGRRLGYNIFMCQNQPSPTGGTTTAGAQDAAEAIGQTVISVAAAGDETIGHWVTIAGDPLPHRVIAIDTGNTITIYPALRKATGSTAVVTHYTQGAIMQATSTVAAGASLTTDGYREGWHKAILFDGGITVAQGQMITFGVGATTAALALAQPIYCVIETDGTTYFVLDRPLEAAVADNAVINPGPVGQYNLAFRRNCMALVSRPLGLPRAGTGALAAVATFNDLSVRVVITYNGTRQGHLVTVDMLCGVKVLDEDQAAVLLG